MGFLRHLAALLLLLGGVLLPLRAVAATIPTFIVYDGAVRSTATTALGRHDAVRPETERARTAWDDASFAYDDSSNRSIALGVRGGLTYDDTLNLAERRQVTKGAIYEVPTATAAANFYTHELLEAGHMASGMSYEAAHAAALEQAGVSPFSLYHPEVIRQFPAEFNNAWRAFWGL